MYLKASAHYLRATFANLVVLSCLLVVGVSAHSKQPLTDVDKLASLGRSIFFDPSLSEPPGVSCASCHVPGKAFSGDNGSGIAVAKGAVEGSTGFRNTPTLMYLSANPPLGETLLDDEPHMVGGMFWDGRAADFEEQAVGPLFSAHEMNNPGADALARRVRASHYAAQFAELFGENVFSNADDVLKGFSAALGAYQRSDEFSPFTSKFDAVLRGQAEFTEQESRGLDWFTIRQKGNCSFCHALDIDSDKPEDSLFTNFTYHALGLPRNLALPATSDPAYADLGLCETMRNAAAPAEPDKYCGLFKTPTLRNIALTPPYMHNGIFDSLRDAVAFYATRDTNPELWFPDAQKFNDLPTEMHGNVNRDLPPYHRKPGKRPALKDDEIDDIVAFLRTLTDGYKSETSEK